ncbi:MAG: protease modulator HflC [Alphaproteobacteria bacterium]
MTRIPRAVFVILAVAFLALAYTILYTVHQTEQALVVQFGRPIAVISDPGLHAKLPWQDVKIYDRRVLNLEAPPEEVIAQDKKRLVVDAFARWRITDPLRFNQTLQTMERAQAQLGAILGSNIRRVLGGQTFAAVLSANRAQLMHDIRDIVNADAKNLGVVIVDVRIRRTDLPPQNSMAIYERMKQERVREANEFRAEGQQIKQEIESKADRDATVIRAEATRKSEILRGEGDGEKNRVLAEAYGRDPDFFAFYRSMKAYEAGLGNEDTTMVLSPDSEFLRYLGRGPNR